MRWVVLRCLCGAHCAFRLFLCAGRFRATAAVIQKALGLSLFGFDVIVPTRGRGAASFDPSLTGGSGSAAGGIDKEEEEQLLVIDVNFFPSYKEVKDFPLRFRAFLRQRAGLEKWPSSSTTHP